MTQKTKLEIIGPYTQEHEGPFCTRDGKRARIICTDRKSKTLIGCPVVALVDDGDQELNLAFRKDGKNCAGNTLYDLMNAREVPVAREFWVNEFKDGVSYAYPTEEEAARLLHGFGFIRTIHVREVLPGDDQ